MQHDFILLDRSGSMQDKWLEAMTACNAYVKKLADDNVDTGVTMATFDSEGRQMRFEIIRDRITPKTWRPVSKDDATPRGMTPLNDAVVELVQLANRGNYDKVAIIIMTDGQENDSRENSVDAAKARLDECRAKNWQVIFLGASFDNIQQSASLGGVRGQSISASAGTYAAHSTSIAQKRADYASTGATMDWSEKEKAQLNKGGIPNVSNTTGNKT
jgi:uncharacterized protein YegL